MHRYTQDELQSIFTDRQLANELIPHIKNNKIDEVLWKSQYQKIWKQIQQQLKVGMLCPICGQILFKFYEKHFKKHGISVQQVYNESHDIKTIPRCPICGKETEFVKNKWFYRKFCCCKHQVMYIDIKTGLKFGWKKEDIDEHNNKIWESGHKASITLNKKYGSEFATELNLEQRENRGLIDDELYEKWRQNQIKKKSSAGKKGGVQVQQIHGCNAKSYGYTSIVNLTEDKQFSLDSQAELFHLLKRVFIDKDQIDNFENKIFLKNTTSQFGGHSAYTDLVVNLNGIKINYEVHDISDIQAISRKKYCSELNGYQFVLESTKLYTYPNGKYVNELKQFIDVDSIYEELVKSNRQGYPFVFNLYKYI